MNQSIGFRIIISAKDELEVLAEAFSEHTILHHKFAKRDHGLYWKWSGEFSTSINGDGLISTEEMELAVRSVNSALYGRDDIQRRGIALDLKAGDLLALNLDKQVLSSFCEYGFEFGFEIFQPDRQQI